MALPVATVLMVSLQVFALSWQLSSDGPHPEFSSLLEFPFLFQVHYHSFTSCPLKGTLPAWASRLSSEIWIEVSLNV